MLTALKISHLYFPQIDKVLLYSLINTQRCVHILIKAGEAMIENDVTLQAMQLNDVFW